MPKNGTGFFCQHQIPAGCYYYTAKTEGADPGIFEILKYGYSKDKDRTYYAGKEINGSDSKTFKVKSHTEAEDKENHCIGTVMIKKGMKK